MFSENNQNQETITIDMSESLVLNNSWDVLEEYVYEYQDAILDVQNYTLYTPKAQCIRWVDFLLNFGGDPEFMLSWIRKNSSDKCLVYDYGYAVFIKEQMKADENFKAKIISSVISLFPELKEPIKEALKMGGRRNQERLST